MNGKPLIIGMLSVAAVAGVGLWYSIERAYYRSVSGVDALMVNGDMRAVSEYTGIDADTSPLKMRACFTVDWDYVASDTFKEAATPLRAPRYFKCFDAGQMTADLETGHATAILAAQHQPYGFDTYIVQYPDGRGFMWRQINACGEARFTGNDLPEGCPNPANLEQSLNTAPVEGANVQEVKYHG